MMRLLHGRVHLTLHELTARPGPPLLLLHELYSDRRGWGDVAAGWPGNVYALDFCGHGDSQAVKGGSYTPELLVADADLALQQLGEVSVVGAGIGAYVALLLAGARAGAVRRAVLLAGAGLAGGGATPDFTRRAPSFWPETKPDADRRFDPMVRLLEMDVRPVDYVQQFAVAARSLMLVEDGSARPPWWEATRRHAGRDLEASELEQALAQLVSGYAKRTGEK
ncbi:MAG: alpha/beta hydrolase [Deltaproteobacteria bacterium]|nr:alpha/beta hydrolase [Deltaproteobacteria bacterium]